MTRCFTTRTYTRQEIAGWQTDMWVEDEVDHGKATG